MRGILAALVMVSLSCSDSGRKPGGGTGGGGSPGGGSPGGGSGGFAGCGMEEFSAEGTPAAMLVVLDRSSSMASSNKYAFAAQAIVQALDADVFDTMTVGLMAAPSGSVAGPECLLGTQVACQAPPFPQIQLAQAGTAKSNAGSGVRHDIYQWLASNMPDSGEGDATPVYAALQNAIAAVQSWPGPGKRIVLLVTDGTLDCTQFSTRAGYADCNGCDHDWESPDNVIQLLKSANADPSKPVDTFIMGVPGSDTYDSSGCMYPPYHMRNALSAIAYAGSPANAPANCDGKTYSQSGADPMMSCHFDMTQGNFSVQSVADAISVIRGKVLGCTFDLPAVDGGMIDPSQVNVEYSVAGGPTLQLYKRADPANTCAQSGCWDWTVSGMQLQLIGKACDDVKSKPGADVKIVVGCATVVM
jgi:hypothetical protein